MNTAKSKYLRLPAVRARYGIGASTIWRWVNQGFLPRPKKLGPRTSAWSIAELDEFDSRRDGGAPG